MEISLKKIELVKDRTGVSYREAKDALIKANGSVVDAIILIEDEIDIAPKTRTGDQAQQMVEKAKALIRKGNISRLVVKKGSEIILNIPVTLGIIGAICIPWVTVITTVAALGAKCSIELVKDNGDVVKLSEKASETFDDVREGCEIIADDIKVKGSDAYNHVKSKAAETIGRAKSEKDDYYSCDDDDYFNFDDDYDFDDDDDDDDDDDQTEIVVDFDDDENFGEYVSNAYENTVDDVKDFAEKAKDAAEDAADKIGDGVEDAAEAFSEKMDEADKKIEETINSYKAKKERFRIF